MPASGVKFTKMTGWFNNIEHTEHSSTAMLDTLFVDFSVLCTVGTT